MPASLPRRHGAAAPVQPFEIPAPSRPFTEGPSRLPRSAPSRLPLVALVVVLVAATVGGAWWFLSNRGDEPTHLALSFPPEGSQVYRMGATIDWQSDSRVFDAEVHTEFEGILTFRTLSVDGDLTRLRAILDMSSLSVNGRPVTKPPTLRSVMRMGSDGTVDRGGYLRLPDSSPPIMLNVTGLTPDLPDRSMVPGETWTDSVSSRATKDRYKGTARTTFVRYEDLDGVTTAVLQGTRELRFHGGPPVPGRGTMTIDQTAWVNPETGKALRMTATVRFSFRDSGGVIEGVDRYELRAV